MRSHFCKVWISIIILLLALCLVVGGVFAYYQFMVKGWRHTISSASVAFTFNGKTFIDSIDGRINSSELNISKGEEKDLRLVVRVRSSTESAMGYTINFGFGTKEEDGLQVKDDKLARAIEVYLFKEGGYSYLCNMDKISSIMLDGDLVANQSYAYDLRLVYSQGAGDYYRDKTFTLKATAHTKEASLNLKYNYVKNESELKTALTTDRHNNKNIVLTRDINIINSINATNRVRINLNGYKLLVGEGASDTPSISFLYANAFDNQLTAGIVDDSAISNSLDTTHNKINVDININTPNDIFIIGESLADSFEKFTCTSYLLESAKQLIQNRIYQAEKLVFNDGEDLKLFKGLGWYIENNLLEVTTDGIIFNEQDLNANGVLFSSLLRLNANLVFTANYQAEFTLSDNNTMVNVGGIIKVRGNSPQAVAEAFVSCVPDTIMCSLFFPCFDELTNSFVSWIISDNNANYLDENGTILPKGVYVLDSWSAKTITVGVKVACGDIQYTAYKTVTVTVLNGEERTQKLYKYQQIILQPDETTDLMKLIYADNVERAALKGISVSLNAEDNIYSGNINYLEVSPPVTNEQGVAYEYVTVKNSPTEGAVKIRASLTFDYGQEGLYILNNLEIIVLAKSSTYEISDSANAIQKQYETNTYTLDEGFSFVVSGNITNNVFVEYFLPEIFRDYVLMRQNVFLLANAEDLIADYAHFGFYALLEGDYCYFSAATRFDQFGNASTTGEYVKILTAESEETLCNLVELLNSGLVFRRVTEIKINAEKLSINTVTANIYANLYTISEGNKEYITETITEEGESITRNVTFNFSLVLTGIIHNNANEIADYNLYASLLNFYDANGDGYITKVEATADWNSLSKSTIIYFEREYTCLDFSYCDISSLKGLEYFTYIKGLKFSNNKLIDIFPIENLRQLIYLDLSDNFLTNITSLSFSDSLRVLILQNNNITNIEPLRYLSDLVAVDLYQNNIGDFDPISGLDSLIFLDVRYSGRTTITADVKYYFTLLYVNNKNNSIIDTYFSMKTDFVGGGDFSATQTEQAAALALSNVYEINELYTSLFTPSVINYDGKLFYLLWGIRNNDRIIFDDYNGLYTTGCTIVSGIVEEALTLTLTVTDSTDLSQISLQRTFDVILLPSQLSEATAYLQLPLSVANSQGLSAVFTDSNYAYVKAKEAIPDRALRGTLFNYFNTTIDSDSSPIIIYSQGGVSLREKYVLTYLEMTDTTNLNAVYDFSYRNISDLSGLNFFTIVFSGTQSFKPAIDLRGNQLDGLSELNKMNGVTKLYLGGQEYDFTQLLGTAVKNGDTIVDWSGGLTTLSLLSVYECYNLDSEEVQKALYMTYIANTAVDIYLTDAASVWNPYEKLYKHAQSWPSIYSVMEIGDYSYFENDFVSVNFYDYRDINFYVTDLKIDKAYWNANTSAINYFENGDIAGNILGVNYYTNFIYRYLVGYDCAAFLTITVQGNDGRGALTDAFSFITQISAQLHNKLYICDLPSNNAYVIKYGKDLDYFDGQTTKVGILPNCVAISDVFTGRSVSALILYQMSRNTSGGLRYFKVSNSRRVDNYADFANGTLTSSWYAYFDSTTGNTYISRKMPLAVTSTVNVDGSYFDRGDALSGLDLTGCLTVNIQRDCKLGDGSYLVNVRNLTVYYSFVDLSKINVDLVNLISLDIGSTRNNRGVTLYHTDEGGNTVYAFSHMPNLNTLRLITSNCYDWEGLKGFLYDSDGNLNTSTQLSSMSIYENSNANSNANVTDLATLAMVNEIYNLYVTSHMGEMPLYYVRDSVTVYSPEGTGASFVYGVSEPGEYIDFSSRIFDLSAKVNDENIIETNIQILSTGDIITLPLSTYNTLYGVLYAPNAVDSKGENIDSVRAFAITWILVGLDSTTFNNMFTHPFVTATNTTYNGTKSVMLVYDVLAEDFNFESAITLTYSSLSTFDYYFVAVGHIGEGYFDKDSNYILYSDSLHNYYNFVYPFLAVGATPAAAGTSSYAEFKDVNLRFFVFSVFGKYTNESGYSGCLDINTKNTLKAQTSFVLTDMPSLLCYSSQISVVNCYNSFNSHSYSLINCPQWVITLKGVELFENITSITVTDNLISDITHLSDLTQLTQINLSGNIISDISALSSLPISILNLSYNPINSLSAVSGTLKSSIDTLILTYCTQIGGAQLSYLVGANNLNTLRLFGTACAYDFYEESGQKRDAIYWLNQINRTINLTLNTNTLNVVTPLQINTFYNYYAFLTAIDHSVYSDNTAYVITETVEGITYTKTFNDRVFFYKDTLGKNSTALIKITSDANPQFVAYREIGFNNPNSTANYTVVSNGQSYLLNLFNSRLFAFILDNQEIRTVDSVNQIISVKDNITINVTSDIGFYSLEGMQYLQVSNLYVTDNNLIKTWTQFSATNFTNSVTNLTIESGFLKAVDLAFLSYTTKINSLDISRCKGINYYDAVFLANIIKQNTTIRTLSVNDAKGIFNFISSNSFVSARDYVIALFNAKNIAYCSNVGVMTNITALAFNAQNGERYYYPDISNTLSYYALISSNANKYVALINPTTTNNGTRYATNVTASALAAANGRRVVPIIISWTEINTTEGIKIYLPKNMTEIGESYYIEWRITSTSTTALLTFIDGVVLLNRSNLNAYSALSSVRLRAYFYKIEGGVPVSSTSTAYNFYITITFINKTERVLTNTNYYLQLLEENAEYGQADYFDGTYYYYQAANIFKSGNLLDYMYKDNKLSTSTTVGKAIGNIRNIYNNDIPSLKDNWAVNLYAYKVGEDRVFTTESEVEGYEVMLYGNVIPYSFIDSLQYFYLPNLDVTSISGMEIFSNLIAVQFEYSQLVDISPLSKLTKLEYFYYYVDGSSSNRMQEVLDFSPLIKGAGDTLKEFAYCYNSGIPLNDLSFLTAFKNLQRAYIYLNDNSASAGIRSQIFNTLSFKYVLAYFSLYQPDTKVYVGLISIANTITMVDKTLSYVAETLTNTIRPLDGTKEFYRIFLTDIEFIKAAGVLSKFDIVSMQTAQSVNLINSLVNGGNVFVDTKTEDYNSSKVTYLPAYIENNGSFYVLKYSSGAAALKFGDYKLLLNSGISLITLLNDMQLVNAFIQAGVYKNTLDAQGVLAALSDMKVNYEQITQLLNSRVISQYINDNILDFAVLLTIELRQSFERYMGIFTAQIYVDGFAYERMLSLYTKQI